MLDDCIVQGVPLETEHLIVAFIYREHEDTVYGSEPRIRCDKELIPSTHFFLQSFQNQYFFTSKHIFLLLYLITEFNDCSLGRRVLLPLDLELENLKRNVELAFSGYPRFQ